MLGQYEYCRLVKANIKFVPAVQGGAIVDSKEWVTGYSCIALDLRPSYTAGTSIDVLVAKYKYSKLRPYPQPVSMKVGGIAQNCKMVKMAVWQSTSTVSSLFYLDNYDYKFKPPVYRIASDIFTKSTQTIDKMGYYVISYTMAFKNFKMTD